MDVTIGDSFVITYYNIL